MSNAKKIAIQGKSAMALVLMLFFCFSAFAKGFSVNGAFVKPAVHSKTKAGLGAKNPGTITSAFDIQDDNDADDIDFALLPDFSLQLPPAAAVFQTDNTCTASVAHTKISFHLYDLYCNWKSYLL